MTTIFNIVQYIASYGKLIGVLTSFSFTRIQYIIKKKLL